MAENTGRISEDEADIIDMTAHIVSSYLSSNHVGTGEIPALIHTVHEALQATSGGPVAPALQPAVPVRQSVKPDHIVCLEDGRKLKMLKRHLSSAYGMTPDEYRQKWQLPADYPMVAPNYAEQRSKLAKKIGLGRRKGER